MEIAAFPCREIGQQIPFGPDPRLPGGGDLHVIGLIIPPDQRRRVGHIRREIVPRGKRCRDIARGLVRKRLGQLRVDQPRRQIARVEHDPSLRRIERYPVRAPLEQRRERRIRVDPDREIDH